ncbi:nuclear transport factor 2 family protein [Janthinobacterium sp. 1_2014MBL_MicDiv]|uniref:nuclear transport factor 2 family protein n=1 Tax=Janthinobacterium sp. 1_2014MBL_MicDiv TaxID=1644131 RepID=UPI0008F4B823|nr:nuclear transport factor 2 family protein [Janthinobacterium sp. 1_2014MBL_MicDiv]APA69529.1 cytochrome P450 [Janthinobacterium sp. 1_2014MBL_MicDiv]
MNALTEVQVLDVEERLRQAMMASDVAVLNDLLGDDLLFTNHLGHLLSKHADLAAHEQRLLTITDLRASERHVRLSGDVAVVSVRMQLTGSYHDVETHGDFRFTRVWARNAAGALQVIAAHSGVIA